MPFIDLRQKLCFYARQSVDKRTQKVMDGFQLDLPETSTMGPRTTDSILELI